MVKNALIDFKSLSPFQQLNQVVVLFPHFREYEQMRRVTGPVNIDLGSDTGNLDAEPTGGKLHITLPLTTVQE